MRIIILSKAPVPGRVKTRLLTKYMPVQAAKLHEKMTTTVINKALKVCKDVWLAVDDTKHPFFETYKSHPQVMLHKQIGGDLGDRLTKLYKQSRNMDKQPVLFLGTDSPHIEFKRYLEAQKYLETYDVVLGPVEDGGYDLIALRAYTPEIFQNINWGSDSVFKETHLTIKRLGLSLKVLDMSFDLDRPQDIERAPPSSW